MRFAVLLGALALLPGCANTDVRSGSEPDEMAVEPMNVGQTVNGELADSDFHGPFGKKIDVFSIRGNFGEQVTASVRATGMKPTVFIQRNEALGFGRGEVAPESKVWTGDEAVYSATLPEDSDGIYYMYVGSSEYGSYTLSLTSGLAPKPGLSGGSFAALASGGAPIAATPARYDAAGLPEPILGNTGAFMCPFTEDGTVAPWVEKGMSASVGANVGGAVGSYAGTKVLEQVPLLGSFLGKAAGESAGRNVAINAAGGWSFIKSSSDLSFNNLRDMARYVRSKHAAHPQFAQVLNAVYGIYPDFKVAVTQAR